MRYGYTYGQRAVLARLRTLTDAQWEALPYGGEGLWRRLMAAARSADSLEAALETAATRRYPRARLRRMLLCADLGGEAGADVPYLRVLAANEKGRALLKRMKKTASAPILTKSADVKKLSVEAQRLFETEVRATDRYVLSYPSLSQSKPGSEWTNDPVIL